MGRAPCCEKMGLKKGPWTKEEDHILIDYISQHGHGNWRALPKLAGLLRCGKSCRLRWTNYLRPGIKRGNFSKEEEDTILKLHQVLGNRWSAIASRLPGRTDNEIKNVWNTHLKKRHNQPLQSEYSKSHYHHQDSSSSTQPLNSFTLQEQHNNATITTTTQPSPPRSTSNDVSSTVTDRSTGTATQLPNPSPMLDVYHHDFWIDKMSHNDIQESSSSGCDSGPDLMFTLPQELLQSVDHHDCGFPPSSGQYDMDYWSNVFTRTDEGISELLQFGM